MSLNGRPTSLDSRSGAQAWFAAESPPSVVAGGREGGGDPGQQSPPPRLPARESEIPEPCDRAPAPMGAPAVVSRQLAAI